ncbi:MAG: hypothetical protein J5569_04595 [Oscillospiraceae bacterium]|nr:hypothetical protein [Oscillospiraceae bacterium]
MKILICIDDTDNLDSIGTGQLLEDMCAEAENLGLAKGGFVTRHQLLIHEDIEYTSHNSSMCCEAETEDLQAVSDFAKEYLASHAAEGSDPGICILRLTEGADHEKLREFGKLAQTVVLKKADAYSVAAMYPGVLSLTEHGGTGDGVIGALAGVGLRLTGSDGRVKGKIRPERENETLTVREFCGKYPVEQVMTEDGELLPEDTELCFTEPTKAVMADGTVTLIAVRDNGRWIPRPHKGKKK